MGRVSLLILSFFLSAVAAAATGVDSRLGQEARYCGQSR